MQVAFVINNEWRAKMRKDKSFVAEFKAFISRGNVIDLAVGVIIGGAFTAIVTSMVNDIIMPVIGSILGGVSFEQLKYVITPASGDMAETAICYGSFIQSVVNFLLIAFVVFVVIKGINRLHKKKEAPEQESPKPSEDVTLLKEIRDLLQQTVEPR